MKKIFIGLLPLFILSCTETKTKPISAETLKEVYRGAYVSGANAVIDMNNNGTYSPAYLNAKSLVDSANFAKKVDDIFDK